MSAPPAQAQPPAVTVDPPSKPAAPRKPWHERVFPPRYRVPLVVTGSTSLLLCVGFLMLPLAGTDLSAQVARGHFFEEHGPLPVDFRWYGGVFPFGYSLLTGPLNALLGSRGVGATACVISAMGFAWLLTRFDVRRPTVAGVLAAVVGCFNLVSGRTTFAMGLAFGMLALCMLATHLRPGWRLGLAAMFALLAGAGSPVAAVFVGLCGAALLSAGKWREGLALGVGAGVSLLPAMLLFHDGGTQPFSRDAMKVAVAACAVTYFLIPRRYQAVRIGTVFTALVVLYAFYMPTPMGSNAVRLPMLFAAPVVVAVSELDRRWLAAAVAAMAWWQPPLIAADLNRAGDPAAHRLFYQPLIDELASRGPVGRVEVVPLANHWESTYVADAVPIARGWLRQVDVDRNTLFYRTRLTPASYLEWLYRNAVEYVAVPRDAALDRSGRQESALIAADLPYLEPVWENADWRLYKVVGSRPIVDRPAELRTSDATGVTFTVSGPAELTVRVAWSRWLVLRGPEGCIEPDEEGFVTAHVERAGTYELTSDLHLSQPNRC